MTRYKNIYLSLGIVAFFVAVAFGYIPIASAGVVDDLKKKITERNQEIEKLEVEIEGYKEDLEVVGEEKHTLNNAIYTLNLTQKKLNTDISITQNKISGASYAIDQFGIEIKGKEVKIGERNDALAESIRQMNEIGSYSLVEIALSNGSLSDFFDRIDSLQKFQSLIRSNVKELVVLKGELEGQQFQEESTRNKLLGYNKDLKDQNRIVANNKSAKSNLLSETKNKEANFQKLLNEKLRLKEEFERELSAFESELRFALDPSLLPPKGSGVLAWPVESGRISQYFGNTKFAQSGAYNGSGHNGIDIAVVSGTKVKSAASGTVIGSGNTDQYQGCYSYGKWALVEHENGLTTLYAHMSQVRVNVGDIVSRGGVVGFSGNTGYSTGPHLHFTTYASEGVKIVRLGDIKRITNCGDARIPVAAFNAYLNPIDYLEER